MRPVGGDRPPHLTRRPSNLTIGSPGLPGFNPAVCGSGKDILSRGQGYDCVPSFIDPDPEHPDIWIGGANGCLVHGPTSHFICKEERPCVILTGNCIPDPLVPATKTVALTNCQDL